MPARRCRHCRGLVQAGDRCTCRAGTRTGYDSAERRRRRDVVLEHLELYGPVCPGWQREEHWALPRELTADHVVPVAAGGDQDGALRVLCRSCNSRRGMSHHL